MFRPRARGGADSQGDRAGQADRLPARPQAAWDVDAGPHPRQGLAVHQEGGQLRQPEHDVIAEDASVLFRPDDRRSQGRPPAGSDTESARWTRRASRVRGAATAQDAVADVAVVAPRAVFAPQLAVRAQAGRLSRPGRRCRGRCPAVFATRSGLLERVPVAGRCAQVPAVPRHRDRRRNRRPGRRRPPSFQLLQNRRASPGHSCCTTRSTSCSATATTCAESSSSNAKAAGDERGPGRPRTARRHVPRGWRDLFKAGRSRAWKASSPSGGTASTKRASAPKRGSRSRPPRATSSSSAATPAARVLASARSAR